MQGGFSAHRLWSQRRWATQVDRRIGRPEMGRRFFQSSNGLERDNVLNTLRKSVRRLRLLSNLGPKRCTLHPPHSWHRTKGMPTIKQSELTRRAMIQVQEQKTTHHDPLVVRCCSVHIVRGELICLDNPFRHLLARKRLVCQLRNRHADLGLCNSVRAQVRHNSQPNSAAQHVTKKRCRSLGN